MPLLTELMGRTTDVLEVNGRSVGSPVLTVLMGKLDVEQYQIVQTPADSLVFRIVRGKGYGPTDEAFIRRSLVSHLGELDLRFEYVPSIEPEEGRKHKFIIRETTQ